MQIFEKIINMSENGKVGRGHISCLWDLRYLWTKKEYTLLKYA